MYHTRMLISMPVPRSANILRY